MKILQCDKCGMEYEKTARIDDQYDCCCTENQAEPATQKELRLLHSIDSFIREISYLCPDCLKSYRKYMTDKFEFLATKEEK